jgi:hypothetical protein
MGFAQFGEQWINLDQIVSVDAPKGKKKRCAVHLANGTTVKLQGDDAQELARALQITFPKKDVEDESEHTDSVKALEKDRSFNHPR